MASLVHSELKVSNDNAMMYTYNMYSRVQHECWGPKNPWSCYMETHGSKKK